MAVVIYPFLIQVSGSEKPPDAVSNGTGLNRAVIQSQTSAEIMQFLFPVNMFLLSFGRTENFCIKAVHY